MERQLLGEVILYTGSGLHIEVGTNVLLTIQVVVSARRIILTQDIFGMSANKAYAGYRIQLQAL